MAPRSGEAIFKHDIPALYVRYADGVRIRGFDLTWGENLPAYFSGALEAEDAKNLDYVDFKPSSAAGSPAAPVSIHSAGTGKGESGPYR